MSNGGRKQEKVKDEKLTSYAHKPVQGGGDKWCVQDIAIDTNLCVHIKNSYLADEIERAIYSKGSFCMVRDDPNAPGLKVNVVC